MNFDFDYYGPEIMDAMMPMVSTLIAIYTAVFAIALLFGLVLHVIRALALQGIAKRRGISNGWLAWIPVGQEWIIGSLSDQYKYLTIGKNQSRRKVLLWLNLVALVVGVGGTGICLVQTVRGLSEMSFGYGFSAESAMPVIVPAVLTMVISVVSMVVGIAAYVFRQMSMYDLYKSCDPKNAVIFLVLGILFSVTEPFFLLACKNKDGGMPPRKTGISEPAAPTEPAAE